MTASTQATPTGHRSAVEIGRTDLGARPLPELGSQRAATEPAFVDTVIDNGLRVIAVRQPTVPMVELRLRIPFGSNDSSHPAQAELLADTLLTGTRRRDRVRIDTDLALVGGELDTAVDPERLALGGSALADGLDALLDVLADVLTEPAYADDEVARERDRLVERIAVALAQPGVIARKALQRRRYGDHPFAHEMPEPEDVAAVTAEQVRALHARAVVPRGAVLILVGDLDPAAAVRSVTAATADWTSEHAAVGLDPLPELTAGDLLLVNRPGAVQSQLRLSAQTISRTDPCYPALQLANLVFGGYFSSRLVENIREDKGYTYDARSYFEFTPSGGTVVVSTDTASEVSASALLEVRYELGRLGLTPPTAAEVESVRQYAIGSLLTSISSQSGFASQVSGLAGLGLDIGWLRQHQLRLAEVSAAEVADAALEFFAPARFTGVVVGDAELLAGRLSGLGGIELP
ncbi:MAG TPA: pitrilysin family protein [Pseudonocardiaceae bacterium]|nr:pitrilysin family protein [Pseudonocardiaceae bacterium]